MPRAFTLVSCNEYSSIQPGFIDGEELSNLDDLVYLIGTIKQSTEIEVHYMMFLDFENAPVEDVTEEEIEILNERLLEFFDSGYIDVVDTIKIPINYEDNEVIDMVFMD